MEYRTLELNILSAKDLNDVNLFSKMDLYAVVSIIGDPNHAPNAKTHVHRNAGTNPVWNFPVKFTFNQTLADQNRLSLEIKIVSDRVLAGDTLVGTVHVPLRELLDTPAADAGNFRQVNYQVRKPSGKSKGSLIFSYKLGDKVSAPAPAKMAAQPPPMSYPPPPAMSYPPTTGSKQDPVTAYPPQSAGSKQDPATAYPPPSTGSKHEPVMAYPAAAGSSSYPPHGYPPPPQAGYGYPPPPQAGYGYPPPPQAGYGYPPPPQTGYGYPPSQAGYGYPQQGQKPGKKNKFGMGLGAGLLGGALGGLLIGDMVSDVGNYDSGYDAGFDDAGGFDGGFDF